MLYKANFINIDNGITSCTGLSIRNNLMMINYWCFAKVNKCSKINRKEPGEYAKNHR